MGIPRRLEPRPRRPVAARPVVVLTGARRTGTTALCCHLLPDHAYLSLDRPSEAAQAEGDPESFRARHRKLPIIDRAGGA